MLRYAIIALLIAICAAALGIHAVSAKPVYELPVGTKPTKVQMETSDPDPRLERVAEMLAQKGWMCGKVLNVRHVKGDRNDIIHFLVRCLQVYEEAGEKRGTLRVYFVTADVDVVRAVLDNQRPNRKGFVRARLIDRQELKR